jgi:excisionase family DNA binding protein
MADDWITTREAVELSGYHPYHLRRLIREGKINSRKFGTIWQVSRESLLKYLQEAQKSSDKRRGPKR